MFVRVESSPVKYDWGVVNALSDFLGQPGSGKPEAELWFGPHASSSAVVVTEDGRVQFSQWLQEHSLAFPLLVKLLAIGKPLSIQVHPNDQDAARGYEDEIARKIPVESPNRRFVDPHSKPELLIALSERVRLLWGLVTEEDFRSRLATMVHSGFSHEVAAELATRYSQPADAFLHAALRDEEWSTPMVHHLVEWAQNASVGAPTDELSPVEVIGLLHRHNPWDPGILVALAMRWVTLRRGEAVFVAPGEMHCYVDGFGLEIMSPSDNVVRAGLTSKTVDTELFLQLASKDTTRDPILLPRSNLYEGFPAPFRIRHVTESSSLTCATGTLALVEEGSFTLEGAHERTEIRQGQAVFYAGERSDINVQGEGSLWVVDAVKG